LNWRPLLTNFFLVLAVAAVGAVACRAAGVNMHVREMVAAAVVFLPSAELSVVLALYRRNPGPVESAQAALISLVAHLALSLVLSAALLLSGQVRHAFVWWAMAMFWATLIGVSAVLIRYVRSASDAYNAARAAGNGAGNSPQSAAPQASPASGSPAVQEP
jgi:hypothetical protein